MAYEIIRITPRDTPPEERVPLFYIGDDEHTMLAHPRPSLLLEYMDMVREKGLDAAIATACLAMIGKASWDALKTSEDVTDEQVGQILSIIMETVTAQRPEGPKAAVTPEQPSANGTQKSAGSRKSPAK